MIPLGIQFNWEWWTWSTTRPISSSQPNTSNGSERFLFLPPDVFVQDKKSGTSAWDLLLRIYERYSQASLLMAWSRLLSGGAVMGGTLYVTGTATMRLLGNVEKYSKQGAKFREEQGQIPVNTPEYIMGSGTW